VVSFQSSLLDGPKNVVQGVSTLLPATTTLNKFGRGGNGTSQCGSGRVGRVVAKTVLLTYAERFGLQGREMCLDPFEGDLAEKKSPKISIFPLEKCSGANVADAAG